MPRATAITACAFFTSTEEEEGNREAGGRASRRDWYLSVEDRRNIIEQPPADDLDVSGRELRKALRLLRKINPPLPGALNEPDDAAGEVKKLNGSFRRCALAA